MRPLPCGYPRAGTAARLPAAAGRPAWPHIGQYKAEISGLGEAALIRLGRSPRASGSAPLSRRRRRSGWPPSRVEDPLAGLGYLSALLRWLRGQLAQPQIRFLALAALRVRRQRGPDRHRRRRVTSLGVRPRRARTIPRLLGRIRRPRRRLGEMRRRLRVLALQSVAVPDHRLDRRSKWLRRSRCLRLVQHRQTVDVLLLVVVRRRQEQSGLV